MWFMRRRIAASEPVRGKGEEGHLLRSRGGAASCLDRAAPHPGVSTSDVTVSCILYLRFGVLCLPPSQVPTKVGNEIRRCG